MYSSESCNNVKFPPFVDQALQISHKVVAARTEKSNYAKIFSDSILKKILSGVKVTQ
jgi:hypothetical protein